MDFMQIQRFLIQTFISAALLNEFKMVEEISQIKREVSKNLCNQNASF